MTSPHHVGRQPFNLTEHLKPTMFRKMLRAVKSLFAGNNEPTTRWPKNYTRLNLEKLEERECPAVMEWLYTGAGFGDAMNTSNWSTGMTPTAIDELVFSAGDGSCDLSGLGADSAVTKITTQVGFAGTVKLPANFNILLGGLQMNAGSIEINGTLDVFGVTNYTDGALTSAEAAATINLFANAFLAPAPGGDTELGKIIKVTWTVKSGTTTTMTDTISTFYNGKGIVVEAGGEFKITGTDRSLLLVSGDVGTFEVRGKFTMEAPNSNPGSRIDLHFEQLGNTSETNIKAGLLRFRGEDAGHVAVRVSDQGSFVIWGGATIEGATANSIFSFGTGSWLKTTQSSQNEAKIIGDVIINGNLSLDADEGSGKLTINGNLTFAGTYRATVNFTNFTVGSGTTSRTRPST